MMKSLRYVFVGMIVGSAVGNRSPAVEIGHLNDFESGIAGWSGELPEVIDTGGPEGDGDAFLQVVATGGSGRGSHLATFNRSSEWIGDYTAAGVGSIEMDIMNFESSSQDVSMRLVLFGPDSTDERWTSADPIVIANNSQWQHISFPITPETIVPVGIGDSFDDMMENVIRVMVRHDDVAPSRDGVDVVATMGLDNISVLGMTFHKSDFNNDGVLDIQDIDMLLNEVRSGNHTTQFDRTGDGLVNDEDIVHVVTLPDELNTYIGDANLDDEFNSGDLVFVLAGGQYEDTIALNSTWATGDWNGDADFDSSDLVFALQDVGFELGPRAATGGVVVPEPAACMLLAIGSILLVVRGRGRHPTGR